MRLPLFQRATSVRSRVCPVSGGFESVTGASDFGVTTTGASWMWCWSPLAGAPTSLEP